MAVNLKKITDNRRGEIGGERTNFAADYLLLFIVTYSVSESTTSVAYKMAFFQTSISQPPLYIY